MSSKQTRTLRPRKEKEPSTLADIEESRSVDNQSEDNPLGVRVQQDYIDGLRNRFPDTQTEYDGTPEHGEPGSNPTASFVPTNNDASNARFDNPSWEQKLDLALEAIQKISQRVAKIEQGQISVKNLAGSSSGSSRTGTPDNDTPLRRETPNQNKDGIREVLELAALLQQRQTVEKAAETIPDGKLKITKAEREAIANLSRRESLFATAGPTVESIVDPYARAIEKRRLLIIKNWNSLWHQLILTTNKPHVPDKIWKKLAFGQYVDLTNFAARRADQAIADDDTDFKLTSVGTLQVNRESKPKINSLPQWLQAWARFTDSTLILYDIRERELSAYRDKVISLCTTFPFDTVHDWDRAKRYSITEKRGKTLLTADYEIDSLYLVFGRNSREAPVTFRTTRETSFHEQGEICRLFNWSWKCHYGTQCKFKHECTACGGKHPAKSCTSRSSGEKRKRPKEEVGTYNNARQIKIEPAGERSRQ
jgi:hypothetical protein